MDALFMEFVHSLYLFGGHYATMFFRLITILGEKAWFFLIISLILFLNKKTRWVGATAILAIFIGFVIADIGIKPLVMRMRPYTASNLYLDYWEMVGSYLETNYSMPSGHTVGITAFFVSLCITSKKNYRNVITIIGTISVILMIVSRCYFMHHYFSDCLVGVLIGVIVSYTSKAIIKIIYMLLKRHENIRLFNFILNFDLISRL